ncbi:MAG TPA: hypothetical protein VFB22_05590 [Candidatus Baltobacteraceae bacterium]|nr:hypothetical protein [Candidatus Baltobacteraceae bacterium]
MLRAAGVFVLLALLWTCARAAASQDAGAIARTIVRDPGIQSRLPGASSDWPDAPAKTIDGGPALPPLDDGAGSGAAAQVVLWIGIGCAAIFVVALLVDMLPKQSRSGGARRHDGSDRAAPRRSEAEIIAARADELAASGRYTEAIHQILSDTLAVLRRRAGADVPDSFTSRELMRAIVLRDPERGALRDMIARVERTWFAERPAALHDYQVVCEHFRVFASSSGLA